MYKLIRQMLFALSVDDAEKAHDLARKILGTAGNVPLIVWLVAWAYQARYNPRPVTIAGVLFPNRVGLPGGLDKHAEMLPILEALGFGFIEVGTVTPHPQPGQDRPRIFRSVEDEGLINRMGFNSDGGRRVGLRLASVYKKLRIPIAISPGKMKDTPLESAFEDYWSVWSYLRQYAQFGVANISSPNTPGLRELQGPDYLYRLVHTMVEREKRIGDLDGDHKPLFIKLAPDLSDAELEVSLDCIERGGAAGVVMGNTTMTRPVQHPDSAFAKQTGGYSGPQTFRTTRSKLTFMRPRTKLPIIAVGGIDAPDRAKLLFDLGADLVELYTGFIYHGPRLVSEIRALH